MTNNDEILNQLVSLGLKMDEINELSVNNAILYIRFHHEKQYGTSSILFIGFSDKEVNKLSAIAIACNLSIKSRISNDLTFLCFSEYSINKRVEKAKAYGTTVLTKNDFEKLFFETEYTLQDNKFLYDLTVPLELQIAKPLSNFDKNVEVESFSFNSDNIYTVNLHQMTCNCFDFEKKQRAQYSKGDIRKMCRHLMHLYRNNFGLIGLSPFNSYLIENGYSLSKHFRNITLGKLDRPVLLNFESSNDWWDIFVPNEKGIYTKYGYSPLEERFSYDDKPHGVVAPLKQKLKEIKEQLNRKNDDVIEKQQSNKGCVYLVILAVLIICFMVYLIF